MANSPSLAMGLLMFDNVNNNEYFHQQQQSSPFNRSLSNVVAPFIFDNESSQLFEYEFDQYSTKTIDDKLFKYQLEEELASIDALINDF
jgi:hypothetical protein